MRQRGKTTQNFSQLFELIAVRKWRIPYTTQMADAIFSIQATDNVNDNDLSPIPKGTINLPGARGPQGSSRRTRDRVDSR